MICKFNQDYNIKSIWKNCNVNLLFVRNYVEWQPESSWRIFELRRSCKLRRPNLDYRNWSWNPNPSRQELQVTIFFILLHEVLVILTTSAKRITSFKFESLNLILESEVFSPRTILFFLLSYKVLLFLDYIDQQDHIIQIWINWFDTSIQIHFAKNFRWHSFYL